jgi:hypothetical protein
MNQYDTMVSVETVSQIVPKELKTQLGNAGADELREFLSRKYQLFIYFFLPGELNKELNYVVKF